MESWKRVLSCICKGFWIPLGLNTSDLRGQGYDRAGNTVGAVCGVGARTHAACSKAVPIHCASHVLNLCIVAACALTPVRNMMGTVNDLFLFSSYSPKRTACLEGHLKDFPGTTHTRHVGLCKTRWVARHDALELFLVALEPIIDTLDEISESQEGRWNHDST